MIPYVSDPKLLERLEVAAKIPQKADEIQYQRVSFALSNIHSERQNTVQKAEEILRTATKK